MRTPASVRFSLALGIVFGVPLAGAETLVVHNVRGYTASGSDVQSFSGMVIVDGRIERLLTSAGDVPEIDGAEFVDGGGKSVLPGLIDAHAHVLGLGQESLQADLRGAASLADALKRARTHAARDADSRWVLGRGWNQVLWPEKRFPTARELDAAIADRPAAFTRSTVTPSGPIARPCRSRA